MSIRSSHLFRIFSRPFRSMVLAVVFLGIGAVAVQAQQCFYVNSETGSDESGNGSVSAPWATIEKARDTIRELRKTQAYPENGFVVELTGTFSYPEKNLTFTAEDSGESAQAPMVYRASKAGALLVGGSPLRQDGFRKVSEPSVLARLKEDVRDKVWEFDLSTVGISGIEPLPQKFQTWPSVELFSNEKAMQIARFPNQGWLEIPKVVDRGVAPVDRTKDEWEFGVRPAVFEFSEEEPKRWDVSKGIWLMGFWCHDWFAETIKLGAIDTEKKQFTTEVNSRYGVGNHSAWHTAKRRYFALNLLEELDVPGEWYIDVEKNVLYFYPKDGDLSDVVLSVQKKTMFEVWDAKHFILDGIQAKCSLGPALALRNCEDSIIKNVRVFNTTNDGVHIGGGKRSGLAYSEVFNAGRACVSLMGGDRKTLEKCENFVTNCHLHHSGRLQRTSGGYCLYFGGCGCYIAHNLLHDSPYICICYGGNEHLFEFNEVHSAMMESGDGGGMYTGRDWGSLGNVIQFNYFHHFGQAGVDWQKAQGLSPDYEPLKESIMVMGVYLDDCDSGDTVRNNLFYRAGWAAFVGGGRYNKILNNLFIECTASVHFDDRGLRHAKPGEGFKNGWDLLAKIEEMNYDQSPWKERYPFLLNVMQDDPKLPLHNTVRGNISVGSSQWIQMHNTVRETSLHRIDFTENYVFNAPASQQELFPLNPDGSVRAAFRDEQIPLGELEKDRFRTLQQEIRKLVPKYQILPVEKMGLED